MPRPIDGGWWPRSYGLLTELPLLLAGLPHAWGRATSPASPSTGRCGPRRPAACSSTTRSYDCTGPWRHRPPHHRPAHPRPGAPGPADHPPGYDRGGRGTAHGGGRRPHLIRAAPTPARGRPPRSGCSPARTGPVPRGGWCPR
ncbi:DUF5994 family protein [Streptomyces sp. NPDC057806]|uniref:DUF5994 family protein n=1 Tax=Streptomyces sp. NPDC057806 TaxID=3346255 RepID=UPI0036CB1385